MYLVRRKMCFKTLESCVEMVHFEIDRKIKRERQQIFKRIWHGKNMSSRLMIWRLDALPTELQKFVFYPVNGLWDRPVKVPKWQPFWDYPAKMKASCLEKRRNFRRATFRIDPSFNWNILTMDNFCDIVIDGDFSPPFFFLQVMMKSIKLEWVLRSLSEVNKSNSSVMRNWSQLFNYFIYCHHFFLHFIY